MERNEGGIMKYFARRHNDSIDTGSCSKDGLSSIKIAMERFSMEKMWLLIPVMCHRWDFMEIFC